MQTEVQATGNGQETGGAITILSKGREYVCRYDLRDEGIINAHKWHISAGYVCTSIKSKTIRLHRIIMRVLSKPGAQIDHIDHDPLNNKRANLRICTASENTRNSRKFKGTVPFKGVYKDLNKYHTQIFENGKVKNLGRYRSAITAAKVYDEKARELFQSFANPNFPESIEATQLTIFELNTLQNGNNLF